MAGSFQEEPVAAFRDIGLVTTVTLPPPALGDEGNGDPPEASG
jgi:hypothetical protein